MSVVHTIKCNDCGKVFDKVSEKSASEVRQQARTAGWEVAIPGWVGRTGLRDIDGLPHYRNLPDDIEKKHRSSLDVCCDCLRKGSEQGRQIVEKMREELFGPRKM